MDEFEEIQPQPQWLIAKWNKCGAAVNNYKTIFKQWKEDVFDLHPIIDKEEHVQRFGLINHLKYGSIISVVE